MKLDEKNLTEYCLKHVPGFKAPLVLVTLEEALSNHLTYNDSVASDNSGSANPTRLTLLLEVTGLAMFFGEASTSRFKAMLVTDPSFATPISNTLHSSLLNPAKSPRERSFRRPRTRSIVNTVS